MPHPFFDATRFPSHREDAKALTRALSQARPEPLRYTQLYTSVGPDPQPLTPNLAADLAWAEILQNLTAGKRLQQFCDNVLADGSLRNVRPFVVAIQQAEAGPATLEPQGSGRSKVFIAAVSSIALAVLAVLIMNRPKDTDDPAPPPVIVAGMVLDGQGAPIAGSTVSLEGRSESTTTASNGSFRFELPPAAAGRLRLETSSARFIEEISDIQAPNETVQIHLTGRKPISLKVDIEKDGKPISGKESENVGEGHDGVITSISVAMQNAPPGLALKISLYGMAEAGRSDAGGPVMQAGPSPETNSTARAKFPKGIRGVKLRLEGEAAKSYDVLYRVRLSNGVEQPGENGGEAGQWTPRTESIQDQLVWLNVSIVPRS